MGAFAQDFVEAVRAAGDIVRLVSDYVPLKASGTRLKGLCPFHQEKTPSFSVDPNLQLFYCFGCQTGGDLFKFVMLYEKVDFPEAVELLARRWGVPLPSEKRGSSNAPDVLLRIHEVAAAFYRAMLLDAEAGGRCRDYLARRRIDDAAAERLGIGYAPSGWEGLGNHLLARRFKSEEMLKAGLVLPRKSGSGHYDRFRDRLMFPIRDVRGRVVAFGGRALDDSEPKYLNSPETAAYKKGDHLYGLDQARDAIRREGFAIVVEGYLDLAALVQAGFDNTVASLGTAFTPAQARLLARYSERVVFSYDGDAAGDSATARSLDLLLTQGFEVRIVDLPGGADPDDFIGREGAGAYGLLVRGARGYLDYLIDREARARDPRSIQDKVAGINAVLPHLARLVSPIERAQWASRLADAFGVEDDLVLQELRSAVRAKRQGIRQRASETREPRAAESRLVWRLLDSEEERQRFTGEQDLVEVEGSGVAPIVRAIVELARRGERVDYPAVLAFLNEEADRELLTAIAFREEPETGSSVEDCLEAFRRQRLAREVREVRREIFDRQRGGKDGSPGEVDRQLMKLQELARQRDALN